MNRKNEEENKKKSIWLWVVIGVVLLVILGLWLGVGDNSQNPSDENDSSDSQVDVIDKDVDVEFSNVNYPSEVKLYEPFDVKFSVKFGEEYDKKSVKVVLEEIEGDYEEDMVLSKKYSENEVEGSFSVVYFKKEDIGDNDYKLFLVVDEEVVAVKEFSVKGLPEYPFSDDLSANIEFSTSFKTREEMINKDYIKLNVEGYDMGENRGMYVTYILKNNNEVIAKMNASVSQGGSARVPNTTDFRSKEEFLEKYPNLTVDVYSRVQEIYVKKDIKIN